MKPKSRSNKKRNSKKNPKQTRKKEPRARIRTKADLENDPVVKKAMEWLKSDVTVKQFKMDNQKPVPDTAWYMK